MPPPPAEPTVIIELDMLDDAPPAPPIDVAVLIDDAVDAAPTSPPPQESGSVIAIETRKEVARTRVEVKWRRMMRFNLTAARPGVAYVSLISAVDADLGVEGVQ